MTVTVMLPALFPPSTLRGRVFSLAAPRSSCRMRAWGFTASYSLLSVSTALDTASAGWMWCVREEKWGQGFQGVRNEGKWAASEEKQACVGADGCQ